MAATHSLRDICLRLLATGLALPPGGDNPQEATAASTAAAAAAAATAIPSLPQELRQELLQLLARWQLLSDAACAALQCPAFLPWAPSLDISGCSLLSAGALASQMFACPLPKLASLSLKGVLCLSDFLLEVILGQCPGIKQLDTSRCPALTNTAVAAIGSRLAAAPLPALAASREGRHASGGSTGSAVQAGSVGAALADAGWRGGAGEAAGGAGSAGPCMAASSGSASGLESLSLAGCWQISDIAPLGACSCLTSLALDGCWRLGSVSVRKVLACLPLLDSLSLSGCTQLGSAILVSRPAVAPAGGELAGGATTNNLGLPREGVPLYRLRSLDVSGTSVQNDLLYWIAMRCCARLQRLAVAGCKDVDGLGIGAVLAAKRLLLQSAHRVSAGLAAGAAAGRQPQPGASGPGLEVLPLLELNAGGMARWAPADAEVGLLGRWQEQQAAYEQSCGTLCLQPSPDQPPIPWTLWTPAQASPELHHAPQGWSLESSAANPPWPPESAADVLLCLGSEGLGCVEELDLGQGGGAVGAMVAAVIVQHCSNLRRLNLSGCEVSDAEVGEVVLLPHLTQLDVSGCTGSKAAAPGSRFQRRPAKRRQQGGVSDDSLCLLAQRSAAAPSQPIEPSQQPQHPQQQPEELPVLEDWAAGPAPVPDAAAQRAQQLLHATTASASTPSGPPAEPLLALNAGVLLITDAALRALNGLASLQLRGCKRLSDSGVLHCLLGCPAMTRLDLAGCSQLTASALGGSIVGGAEAGAPGNEQPAQQGTAEAQRAQQGSGQASGGPRDPGFTSVVCSLSHAIPRRVALPRHMAGVEALAWLSGLSRPPGGSGGAEASGSRSGSRSGGAGRDWTSGWGAGACGRLDRGMGIPLGCSPLQKLELSCGSWQARAAVPGTGGSRGGLSSSSSPGSSQAVMVSHLAALAAACPQLKSLQLLSAGGLGPGLAPVLSAHCRLLSRLSVTDCCQLSVNDVAALARLPALLHLTISGCPSVGNAGLQAFAAAFGASSRCAALVEGPAAGGASTAASSSIASAQPGGQSWSPVAAGAFDGVARSPGCYLQTLKLDGCGGVTDAGLAAVLAVAPHLATVSLRRLRGVTDATAAAAMTRCGNLRTLLMAGSGVRGGFLAELSGRAIDAGASRRDAGGGSAEAERLSSAAVVCLGLGLLELPQALHSRLHGPADLEELCRLCPQLAVKFA